MTTEEIKDDSVAPSTTTEVEVKPEGIVQPEGGTETSASEEKPKDGFQKRINQITRDKHELRQVNEGLQKQIDDLRANQQKPEVKVDVAAAPNEDDYESDSLFQTALIEHAAEAAATKTEARIRAENDSRDQQSAEKERQTSLQGKKNSFEKEVDAKRANFEDFDEVAYGHAFMDAGLAEQIFDLDKGPEVAYHLGSNLDEAARIHALDPVSRARELTKIEFQVESLKPNLVSNAPDAITPLGNNETVERDPDKMTADQWQAWRNKEKGLVSNA